MPLTMTGRAQTSKMAPFKQISHKALMTAPFNHLSSQAQSSLQ